MWRLGTVSEARNCLGGSLDHGGWGVTPSLEFFGQNMANEKYKELNMKYGINTFKDLAQ